MTASSIYVASRYRFPVALLYGTALTLVVVSVIYYTTVRSPSYIAPLQALHDGLYEQSDSIFSSWSFVTERDSHNYGLNAAQCNIAFPSLYHEIDRAVKFRKQNKIQAEELDTAWRGDGIARCMIYNNQLYIIEARGIWDQNHRPRALATLHSLNRALTAYPDPLPNIEFTFTDHDSAAFDEHTTWAYSRLPEQESLWLMPDFGFWGWPDVGLRSYSELQTLIDDQELYFLDKIPKLVWRGNVNVGSHDVRAALVEQSKDQTWSDVRALDWGNKTNIAENLIGMEDHCDYMFVAQTEGNTYSGRLKYLLNCESIVVSHKLKFLEHFTHLMIPTGPTQNFVQVRRDFKDLKSTVEGLLEVKNADVAAGIAKRARETFKDKYLTPAACACYWRQLVRGWNETQGFETKFWRDVDAESESKSKSKKQTKRKPRGVPFEAFA